MCPVYINRIASIHAESSNEKPYFSAQEPDYKEMITNANLRRRMSRMIKMGVACGLECLKRSQNYIHQPLPVIYRERHECASQRIDQ